MEKRFKYNRKYFHVFLAFLISILLTYSSFSQDSTKNLENKHLNISFLELGGNGIFYSFNYERMMNKNLSVRIGVTSFNLSASGEEDKEVILIPALINYVFGWQNFKFHSGIGILFSTNFKDSDYPLITFSTGFRYQPLKGGMFFQIAVVGFSNGTDFQPSLGLSIGHCF